MVETMQAIRIDVNVSKQSRARVTEPLLNTREYFCGPNGYRSEADTAQYIDQVVPPGGDS